MANLVEWQQGSSAPQNSENFVQISQWWEGLANQEVFWQQRLIPESGKIEEIDWKTQDFDELKLLLTPQVRGLTFYWRQAEIADERGLTLRKVILDSGLNRVLLFSEAQSHLIIRVGRAPIVYQTIELVHPILAGKRVGDRGILLLRDQVQQIEITVTLDGSELKQILSLLAPETENPPQTALITPYSGDDSSIEPEIGSGE